MLDKNDACPYNYGTSTEDRIGCIDTDGDGWSDLGDDFHNKATQWKDSDGDGLGDNWGNTAWNNTRESHWPGEWVANAYLAPRILLSCAGASRMLTHLRSAAHSLLPARDVLSLRVPDARLPGRGSMGMGMGAKMGMGEHQT